MRFGPLHRAAHNMAGGLIREGDRSEAREQDGDHHDIHHFCCIRNGLVGPAHLHGKPFLKMLTKRTREIISVLTWANK